ncbi:MAG: ATP-binding protein [Bryobacteraceae bacterium]|nr:ATP-binding protein [Bryobacteraceae bacterium]
MSQLLLRTLRLQNYRCFRDHLIDVHDSTVIVGKNNAGKSTIIEALQVLAMVTNRYTTTFHKPPAHLPIPSSLRCITLGLGRLGLNLETAFHRYGDPPAILTACFNDETQITAYVHKDGVHATIYNKGHGWVTTNTAFMQLGERYLHILPQISELQPNEVLLTDYYVSEHQYTRLTSRHFRNEIYRHPDTFNTYRLLAESTWPGLRLYPIDKETLTLLVKDGDFAAEVGWMGHGLQMWLQTMWFLAKTPRDSTVVLDEPDVYMHPDLQRKLYRLVKARFKQAIIATHSVEIMAEADPSDILVVNNHRKTSQYANTAPGVQVLIERLGGIHNVHLARLWNAKRVLLVEGKDVDYLKHFHATLHPTAETPLDAIPSLSLGGWDGWESAIGSDMAFKNAIGNNIKTYCIFDRDYHTPKEIKERYQKATQRGISLHIWQRKEIENYLLEPTVIARVIQARNRSTKMPPLPSEVRKFLEDVCDREKDKTQDSIADAIHLQNRKGGLPRASRQARSILKRRWNKQKLYIVSGKTLLGHLSTWAQREYAVSLGAATIVRAFTSQEVPTEIRGVIDAIEAAASFASNSFRKHSF